MTDKTPTRVGDVRVAVVSRSYDTRWRWRMDVEDPLGSYTRYFIKGADMLQALRRITEDNQYS